MDFLDDLEEIVSGVEKPKTKKPQKVEFDDSDPLFFLQKHREESKQSKRPAQ